MIGQLNTKDSRATVIGGGIAGLIAAYRLDQQGYEVTLLEASSRLGGWIRTTQTPWGIAEGAAHSLLVTPGVQKFCDELGVELVGINPKSRARYILRNSKLRRFPLSLPEAFATFWKAAFIPPSQAAVQTMQEWAERHLGSGATNYLISPMIRGIYGSEPDEIALEAAFPSLKAMPGHSLLETQLFHRSNDPRAKRPHGKIRTPLHGMEELVKALSIKLERRLGNRIKTQSPVQALPESGNCILAVPAPAAAKLLVRKDAALATALQKVKYTSLISVTAFLKASDFVRGPQGVGVLVPKMEMRQCLGILFNSSAFKGRVVHSDANHAHGNNSSGVISLTMILAGSQQSEMLHYSDDQIREIVQKELMEILGYKGNWIESVIHRAESAIPQYNLDLMKAWDIAKKGWCSAPGNIVFGNYTGQVSIRGMIESHF